jgi:alpha-1,3-glucan synthase
LTPIIYLGIEYPVQTNEMPIIVTILGNFYKVDVFTHHFENITYFLLDSPIFRARTGGEPYPPRMDDFEAAVFYSCWNQSIAELLRRESVELFHCNDYHCALAPVSMLISQDQLYLLPATVPVAVSVHNGDFQGLFPLRSAEERNQICSMFNLSQEICIKYIQYGNTFNLLHAVTTYVRIHQHGVGVHGVSDKYGDRCM